MSRSDERQFRRSRAGSLTTPEREIRTNAQVRFGGCKPAAGCVLDTTVPDEITSNTFWQLGRWGDYSAITVDPQDPDGAFLVNEYIIDHTTWGSRIAQIHFP